MQQNLDLRIERAQFASRQPLDRSVDRRVETESEGFPG